MMEKTKIEDMEVPVFEKYKTPHKINHAEQSRKKHIRKIAKSNKLANRK